jgi:D-galactose 1-dehydrogenase
MSIRVAIIGFGKIAKDQHIPSIAGNPKFKLAAISHTRAIPDQGVPAFTNHHEMFKAMAGKVDAVAICTPPPPRHDIARDALAAGFHVMLEKPPTATFGEIEHLEALGRKSGRALYTTWHSQHNPAVTEAATMLAGKDIQSFQINWFEDVRKWHPGQEWIWAPGGFGVFDPGINALSISTRILPVPLFVREATLKFPANKQTPIAASLTFASSKGPMKAELDWRYTQGEQWNIRVETTDGLVLELLDGGSAIRVGGGERKQLKGPGEYPSIYERFATLVENGQVEVDREPLRIVADAFLVGRRELVEAFA